MFKILYSPVSWMFRLLVFVGVVGMVSYLLWQGWCYFGPRKPEVGMVRRQAANELIPAMVEDLRQAKARIRSVALVHLANDPSDYVSDRLRTALQQSGIFEVQDETLPDRVRKALHLRIRGAGDAAQAQRMEGGSGAQGVIFGKIHRFESAPEGRAKLDVELTLAEARSGDTVFTRSYTNEARPGAFAAATAPAGAEAIAAEKLDSPPPHLSRIERFLAWGAMVLLLPVLTISFIRTMVRKGSNTSNAFTLGVYLGIDLLLALLMLGFGFSSVISVATFLGIAGLALAYNVSIMTFALRLEA